MAGRRQSRISGQRTGQTYESGFNPDYSHVYKDLRRIGILAGTFFTILVILTFFLR